jgi:hypothetical protein
MILHLTGITDLQRSDADGRDCSQEIVIRDRGERVHLSMMHSSYGARLTADQARQLAILLIAAAERLEQRLAQEPSDV